jgi:hypothetical protein
MNLFAWDTNLTLVFAMGFTISLLCRHHGRHGHCVDFGGHHGFYDNMHTVAAGSVTLLLKSC